jgi:restriction endonuclease S subunit
MVMFNGDNKRNLWTNRYLQEKAVASSRILIIRNNFFNQISLAAFFNTKYGRKMIDKGMYGAAQPEVSPYYILNIPIPLPASRITAAGNHRLKGFRAFAGKQERQDDVQRSVFDYGRLDAEYCQPGMRK